MCICPTCNQVIIEHDIDVSKRKEGKYGRTYPFHRMIVGDSFWWPDKKAVWASYTRGYNHNEQYKHVSENDGYRIKRIR